MALVRKNEIGLGDKFREEIYDFVSIIEHSPDSFTIRHDKFREIPMKLLPHLIISQIDEKDHILSTLLYSIPVAIEKYP